MSDFTPPPPPPSFGQNFGSEMPERSGDDSSMAILAHLGSWLIGFIAPLLIFVLKGKDSRFLRSHAIEALNFQITLTIISVIGSVLLIVLIGFVILAAAFVVGLIFPILATIAASKGEYYKYPLSIRFIKE